MFCIPTYLARSIIQGIGVFAAQPIAAGTLIWEFDAAIDNKFTAGELIQFPEPYRSRLYEHTYIDEEGFHVLCGDNAKFMNHSDDPNCDDSGGLVTVARRDIAAGEELTCDYRSFDAYSASVQGALY